MAYDAAKAHEYYEKYRKKGLKKGRKKKGTTTSLVGITIGGLNDAGRMQAALMKDQIKQEMNEALAKESDPLKRAAIRQKYQQKALEAVSKLKTDPKYATAKKEKAQKAPKAAKSSGKADKSGSESEGKGKSEGKAERSSQKKASRNVGQAVQQARQLINDLRSRILSMTPEQRAKSRELIEATLKTMRAIQNRLKMA